ncbi:MAG: ferredoxin--NADP reductase [Acidimicrobiales bacterium]
MTGRWLRAGPEDVAIIHGGPLPGRLTSGEAAGTAVAGGWSSKSRYERSAEVVSVTRLTSTGTVRIRFRVIDGETFDHLPGTFVGVEYHLEGVGYARSPYCILSPPRDDNCFELLVRVVSNGPISRYLGSCEIGECITFRGPTGRPMVPKDDERDLVLLATGVGVAPFYSLAAYLIDAGFERQVTLYWGLRLEDDLCLLDELDELASRSTAFSYRISLSQPSEAWNGLRGRITESVPPLLPSLGGTRYYLCGNGAMTEEMATALSDMGVADEFVYEEPYFNRDHVPDPDTVAAIRDRFVASDLFSPLAHQQSLPSVFHVDRPLGERRGNADPNAPSDLVRRMPKTAERAYRGARAANESGNSDTTHG